MDYEKDYIMRLIHQIVEFVMRLIFKRKEAESDNLSERSMLSGEKAGLLKQLLSMAFQGRINEAENRLYDELAGGGQEELKLALLFYDGINELSEEELEKQGYSREEIYQGIQSVLARYGLEGIAESVGAL